MTHEAQGTGVPFGPVGPGAVGRVAPTVSVAVAAAWLGIGRTTAYRLAAEGGLPVSVVRIGSSLRVPTAPLLRLLGLDREPDERCGTSVGVGGGGDPVSVPRGADAGPARHPGPGSGCAGRCRHGSGCRVPGRVRSGDGPVRVWRFSVPGVVGCRWVERGWAAYRLSRCGRSPVRGRCGGCAASAPAGPGRGRHGPVGGGRVGARGETVAR